MCGIAGIVSINGRFNLPGIVIKSMTEAIVHRGPDEEGYYSAQGTDFGSRRLSIVGLEDGQQPISNEDGSVNVVFNGELYDYPERKKQLQQRGHVLNTGTDTEILPHLWEESGEDMFQSLRGQFAVAIHDTNRECIILARDRFGICPLYWSVQSRQGKKFLVFASEIKALIASGTVAPEPDMRGIDQSFSFFALPGPVTCFKGVRMLKPGHFLRISQEHADNSAVIEERAYWEIDFPVRGDEDLGDAHTISNYSQLFRKSVERRLQADVPVASYLSGGVDSAWTFATAKEILGKAPQAFTLQIKSPELDELSKAEALASTFGSSPIVIPITIPDLLKTYPRLIQAAECPVSDTVSPALLLLAEQVNRHDYKVALTGEGSDEMLAGYPWFKLARLSAPIDAMGFGIGNRFRRALAHVFGVTPNDRSYDRRTFDAVGGENVWLDLYGLSGSLKHEVYGPRLRHLVNEYVAYEDLEIDAEKIRRWHPFNRSLYFGQRVHLPGLLLSIAGDKVAMHSSVETRYPYLDEDLCDFTQQLHPKWKLRGFREKYLLRRAAESDLPAAVAWRPKQMLRASWDILENKDAGNPFIELLSDRALNITGYFDEAAVKKLRSARKKGSSFSRVNQTLVAVAATQLWHHMFVEDLGVPVERITLPSNG